MILVEIDVSDAWGGGPDWSLLAERAVRAAVAQTPHSRLAAGGGPVEVSVRLTGDAEVRALNRAYRGKDRATNVLSFPMMAPAQLAAATPGDPRCELLLGDVVLAYETCAGEAAERGIATADHAAHLLVHGALHLLGYDHETGDEAAEEMEAAERRALATLGIADPYALQHVHE